jgi:predicted Rossmann-fold nucleotide-binding protein
MGAGNKGASGGRNNYSVGLAIQLPFEQPNKYADLILDSGELTIFKYFFSRILTFIESSDVFVYFKGGFGTDHELFEVLALKDRGIHDKPVILVGHDHWDGFMRILEKKEGFFRRPLNELINQVVDTPAEA